MAQAFLQVTIPVLYVYDTGHFPENPPGFDMNLLPVISRVLKEHAGTRNLTVITGAPTLVSGLDTAFTQLALQYPNLQKASPDAGNLILAEMASDNFDPEAVIEHLKRFIEARDKGARDIVASRYGAQEPIGGAEEMLGLGVHSHVAVDAEEEEEGDDGDEIELVEDEDADEDEEDEGEGGPERDPRFGP